MSVPLPAPTAFALHGPLRRADLTGLCERVSALLAASGSSVALCDVADVEPDAVIVDALARLQLAARREGYRVCVCNASPELLDLIALMGLTEVLCE